MNRSPEVQQVILFLAANPDGLRRVGQELREIKEGLRRSQERDRFSLMPCMDVRPRDIQRALLDNPPNIVHFAGRGMGAEGLVFEDEVGNSKLVDGAALAGLFALFADQIQCVVLNGCYSEMQAKAIAQHIEYVIGVREEINHEASLEFAIGFYDALGAGRPIEFAHKLGCSAIQMQGLADESTPILIQKSQLSQVLHPSEFVTERLGQLWNVPELPPNFLPRQEVQSLKAQVLSAVQRPVVATGEPQRIGVQGMGGIGKSVLAAALAREPEVQQTFPDGIFWVTVGIEPLLVVQQAELAEALSGKKFAFNEVKQGKQQLGELLANKMCLLILDDVWQLDHADAFNAVASHSRLLITTRDAELITGLGAASYQLDVLSDEQSLSLMAAWVGVDVFVLPAAAKAVSEECGNLPLALSLCGAMVRDLTPWSDVLDALREADLGFIRKHFAHYPYPDVFKTLHISVKELNRTNPIAAERYRELVVFPVDESVPEATILRFWQYTGDLKARDARQILTTLASKGLLRLEEKSPGRRVSLHDLQQDYLRTQQVDLRTLHERLLAAYQQHCPEGWHTGPNDGYFFEHLASHLVGARRQDVLETLLFDSRWIYAKFAATTVNQLLADYSVLPDNADLSLVQGALRLSAHILSQDQHQLPSQLHGRLLGQTSPRLQTLVQQIAQFQIFSWLRCLIPSLESADGSLLCTLSGHTNYVTGVVVSPDGRYVISASKDETVKVWELSSGQEVRTFGHTDIVTGVAVSPDGRYVISASWDRTVKVWELKSDQEARTFSRHTSSFVTGVVVSPDGRYVVSASDDETVKIWELSSGQEIRTFSGHTNRVTGVAVSPDGRYVVSASDDETVKVWELSSGQEIRTLRLSEHTRWVLGVAMSPDGHTVVLASKDKTVKVWELSNGQEVRTFNGHTDYVAGVAVSPNGRYVVSASWDKTVKVWELSSGQEVRTLSGHKAPVSEVAVSPNGRYVVSASWDKTVKVWELSSGQEVRTLSGHAHYVYSVLVSPDGHYIISASEDKTVKVWELGGGREVASFTGNGALTCCAVAPDGITIVAGETGGQIHFLRLQGGEAGISG